MSIEEQQPSLKFLSELKIEHHAYFESQLALVLIENAKLWESITKISIIIKDLLIKNKHDAINAASCDPRIKKYLYSKEFFACLSPSPSNNEALIHHLISLLSNPNTSVLQQIHIHGVFAHLIYPTLSKRPTTIEQERILLKLLSPKCLFDESTRARFEQKNETPPTSKLGINRNPTFSKLISTFGIQYQAPHKRALDKFTPDVQSASYHTIIKKDLPFVAGPSGHARTLIYGAALYGQLNTEELKEYVMNIFAYLCIAGNHSFDEVACLVKNIGIPYEQGNYLSLLSQSFIQTEAFHQVANKFNSYLEVPYSQKFDFCF